MFHDTGLPSPVAHVDFTVRSAALAREFADRPRLPADSPGAAPKPTAMRHSPGVPPQSGSEANLMSAGAAVDGFGSRSNEIPDAIRKRVVEQFPRPGFKREFAALWRAETKHVPRGRASSLHRFAVTDPTIGTAPLG